MDLTVKHPPRKMYWRCFSRKGPGHLIAYEGNVNAKQYLDILKNDLLVTIKEQFGGANDCIFQDDFAPCHWVKIVSFLQ